MRTFEPTVRDRVLAAVERVVRAEAAASGAPQEPEIHALDSFPVLVNDEEACIRTQASLDRLLEPRRVIDPGPVTGSEDVGLLASAAGAPCVYWLLGGSNPVAFATARHPGDMAQIVRGLPSNHSPHFAPVIEPTLDTGIHALVCAARTWLAAAT